MANVPPGDRKCDCFKPTYTWIFIWLCHLVSSRLAVLSRPDQTWEQKLVSRLLNHYHIHGRPIAMVKEALNVDMSFHMTQLQGMNWTDDFLKWNPSDYGGINRIVLPPKSVWRPDFGIVNSVRAIYGEMFFKRFNVVVTSDGNVVWMPGGKFVVSCELDITYYPFDDQNCFLDIVDWAYHGRLVDLHNSSSSISLKSYQASGEWEITDTKSERMELIFDGLPYPRVRFSISLRRKPLYYIVNILLPCSMMTALSVLVFYLPPESAEKVNLGVSVMLSFSVFLVLVAENVPKTSEVVPLMVIFITLVMAMTAGSVVICVTVLNVHYRDKERPLPAWLRWLTLELLAPLFCLRKVQNDPKKDREVIYVECNYNPNCDEESSSSEKSRDSNNSRVEPRNSHLTDILNELKDISEIVHETEETDIFKREWTLLAKTLDRCFLVVFFLTICTSIAVLLYIYPATHKVPKTL